MKGEDVRCLCKVMTHWMDKEWRRFWTKGFKSCIGYTQLLAVKVGSFWRDSWNAMIDHHERLAEFVLTHVFRSRNLARPALNLVEDLEDFVGAWTPPQ